MIDIIKQTPQEYSKQSRDYQIIARMYTALFNISKMYIDNMSVWEVDIDDRLSLLRSRTLNFSTRHEWSFKDLESVTSCFKYLIARKGTTKALSAVINILLRVNDLEGNPDGDYVEINDNIVTIKLVKDLASVGIVEDLLKYILPAGMIYRIIEYKYVDLESSRTKSEVIYLKESNLENKSNPFGDYMFVGDSKKDRQYQGTFVYNDDPDRYGS